MTSPLLALFARSLRGDTRVKSTYWARGGLAAFMLVIMAMAAFASFTGGAPGLTFFKSAIWLQTVFLTIAGLGYFASAITEEKEAETLGLLRMTNLSPLAILLGKGTARLCGALGLLVAQVPFTLMAITLGGVSLGQVLAAYCTLGAYTFLLANLALLASVVMARTAGAAALTGGVLLGVFWLGGVVDPRLAAASPFRRLAEIFQMGFDGYIASYQVGANLLAGLACFFLAVILFRFFCEAGSEGSAGPAVSRRWLRRGWFAPPRPRAGLALQWKDFHFHHGGRAAVMAKSILFAALLLVTFIAETLYGGNVAPSAFLAQVFFFSVVWMIAEAGFAASRVCATEVRERTLSSIALLPQNLSFTLSAKVGGAWRSLIPVASLMGMTLLSVIVVTIAGIGRNFVSVVMFGGIAFGYVFAMSYFGVSLTAYLSLRMKRGALPLAIIICVSSIVFTIIPFFGWFGVPIAAVVIGHSLRAKTLQRLEDLAAEN